jgi:peroxiredoxin 2/4
MKNFFLFIGVLFITTNFLNAQLTVNPRIPMIGNEVPSFTAMSTNGQINFPSDFGRKWKIIFSHPRDFTPVCSSEILELAFQQDAFKSLGAEILVVSTDQMDSHRSWKKALEELSFKGRGTVKINFPLVEDKSFAIANSFGMLDPGADLGQSIRGVFFVDPDNKIRAFYFYPNEVGRNVREIQRTLIALQANHKDNRVLLPESWQPGDDVMVKHHAKEELTKENSDLYSVSWFMTYKKMK